MSDFHFLRPAWLLALLPLVALLWALHRRQRGGDWGAFCDPVLLPHILTGSGGRAPRGPLALAGLLGFLTVVALAGPAWERLPTPVFRDLSALVVVLDLSMAMNATDLKPNRLERARFKIEDLLRERKDGQTALVVYAGDAFTVTPITDDAATIAAQLSALSPALMPVQGLNVGRGLELGARLLRQAGLKTGDLLLVTGGEGADGAEGVAAKLHSEGYRVSVLGVGTEDGAPVPLPQGGFLKDERSHLVIPRLDRQALSRFAAAGGGVYQTVTTDSQDLETLLRFLDHPVDGTARRGDTVRIQQWREAGVWLLPLLVPLAALGFRRGWLGLWVALALLPPGAAEAWEWQDLWATPDQRGQRALEAGRPDEAAERFRDPAWKAVAAYRAGRYAEAAGLLAGLDSAAAAYNLGNALARQGRYREALAAYDRALALDPSDQDAQYNRKLVEEALRQRQDKPQPEQSGQDPNQQPSGQAGQEPTGSQGDQGKDKPPQGQGAPPERSPGPRQAGAGKHQGESEGAQSPSGEQPAADAAGRQNAPEQAGSDQTGDRPGQPPQPDAASRAESEASRESRQAEEQWLRRIPDDPGGLLRRKFDYQYRLRQQQRNWEREPW